MALSFAVSPNKQTNVSATLSGKRGPVTNVSAASIMSPTSLAPQLASALSSLL
jgi:hypothetical protein